nr:hypothetical protein Cplu_246 [Cedratvirus plubellavi]
MKVLLAILFLYLALTLVQANPGKKCHELKCGKGHYNLKNKLLCPPKGLAPLEKYFTNVTNHVALVVDSADKVEVQKAYFDRVTMGPWKAPAVFRGYNATYCGQPISLNINIHLTQNRDDDDGEAFVEIFELVDKSKSFFRDWYDEMGSAIIYRGIMMKQDEHGNPVLTPQELEAYLEEQGMPIILHMPQCPKNAYFFQSGYIINEVVFSC